MKKEKDTFILFVEDDEGERSLVAYALRHKGYKVIEADSGSAGLKLMQERGNEVDIIISDVMMSGMTGFEMAEEIFKTYPEVKVLFVSGYVDAAFMACGKKAFFLPKPYTLRRLLELLQNSFTAGGSSDIKQKKGGVYVQAV